MQKYYPVLSVGIALLCLLLPIVILSSSSGKDDPSESEEGSTEVSRSEFLQVQQQLSQLATKLPELEQSVRGLRQANGAGNAPKLPTSKAIALKPASENVEYDKPATPSGNQVQRIEERVEALNKQIAGFITSHDSPASTTTKKGEVQRTPEVSAALEPVAIGVMHAPAADKAVASVANPGTVGPDAMREPEPVKFLTPDQLSKEAKNNLRERVALSPDAPVDEEVPEEVVDVVLQTPRDGMTVNRVEQLYAQSRAPGWPVVLVRSSSDDEEWWAQPISGRRGTQITARVHFGNDGTPRGSAFSMVILLLDGYQEAVRFRTARRFKEIPKGIRRSQVFMYVLK